MRTGVVERSIGAVAARLGIEVGQAYTLVTGVVLALVLGVFGLPPVLDRDGVAVAAADPAAPPPPTTVPDPGAFVPDDAAPTDPAPAPAAAPPTTVPFRPPPPPPRDQTTTTTAAPTTTTTTAPAPRPPIPTQPDRPAGSWSVFATVPVPGAPHGIGTGPDGQVYVATDNATGRGGVGPSEIVAFTTTGAVVGSFSVTGQPEQRSDGLTGLAVDGRGRVLVADASTSRLLRLDPSQEELSELVTIPDVGLCLVTIDGPCEPGAVDGAPALRGLAVADDGAVLVADRGQGIVWRFGADGLSIAHAVTNRTPGEGPVAVAESSTGLVVAVSGVADTMPPGQSAVVDVVDGTSTVRTTYSTEAGLAAVAVGRSNAAYVVLANDAAVDVVTVDGTTTRLDATGVDLDDPRGVVVDDGRLLVTSRSGIDDDPGRWAIHAVVIDDRPR